MSKARFYQEDFYQQIEFDKILSLCADLAFHPDVKSKILGLEPSTSVKKIDAQLNLTNEAKIAIENQDSLPLSYFDDLGDSIEKLAIDGYVLDQEQIIHIGTHLYLNDILSKWLNKGREMKYPHLSEILTQLPDLNDEWLSYQRIFDTDGEVKPDASPELKKLYSEFRKKERQINSAFASMVKKYQPYLAETEETVRLGRRVLSILSEHKRKIGGIIHDESATGKIVYIEPPEIVELNNDYYDLENEIRKEINKILKVFCAELSQKRTELESLDKILQELDFILAKAKMAIDFEATKPQVTHLPHLEMKEVRHPLLQSKLRLKGEEVVPFDLHLYSPNHLIVISGPNAGGKSVTLKAVALVQTMHQCGMLTTVDSSSKMGVFKSFFADIGDQQSLEEDLSTYSSHLTMMKKIINHGDEASMILLDEFGSGSDPMLGASLAESILKQFVEKKVWGVITSHYSNLKIFAHKTKGVINGGMRFDQENYKPTYELQVAKPGNSYTFEIAEQIGLPKDVLAYARKKAGKNTIALENLLLQLEKEQKKSSDLNSNLEEKQKQLDGLIKSYHDLKRRLEFEKVKLKEEKKISKLQEQREIEKKLDKKIKEILKSKDVDELKKEKDRLKKEKETTTEELVGIQESLVEQEAGPDFFKNLREGDYVKIRTNQIEGQVLKLDKKKATILSGDLKIDTKIKDLLPIKEPIERTSKTTKTFLQSRNGAFERRLDIRGERLADASSLVQTFLDEALVQNVEIINILHGRGNGVLKKMVWEKLKEYPTKSVRHPEREGGGDGVTIVTF